MIPPRNLSLLANRLASAGGRRLPEAVLERDYCLAWLLIALSRTPLRQHLAFKGGTAIKRCYVGGYRFSEDLDFTLLTESTFGEIRQGLDPVFAEAPFLQRPARFSSPSPRISSGLKPRVAAYRERFGFARRDGLGVRRAPWAGLDGAAPWVTAPPPGEAHRRASPASAHPPARSVDGSASGGDRRG